MEKLQTWVGLTEMATVCQVQPFSLFTQGQQIKVYSQVYRYCYEKNIVVEKDGYICKDDERYTGAHVFPPVPGIYNRVVPFDFASLKMGEKRYF
jgi:DNA polymerase elongation subunit (family B)